LPSSRSGDRFPLFRDENWPKIEFRAAFNDARQWLFIFGLTYANTRSKNLLSVALLDAGKHSEHILLVQKQTHQLRPRELSRLVDLMSIKLVSRQKKVGFLCSLEKDHAKSMFRDAKCFPFVNDVLAEQLHLG
jgi:hypothetical protein